MMFLLDLAFAVELIALGVGTAFLIWSYRNHGRGVVLAKIVGYAIILLAILGLTCTSYYGTKYWREGYFKSPITPHLILQKQMQE